MPTDNKPAVADPAVWSPPDLDLAARQQAAQATARPRIVSSWFRLFFSELRRPRWLSPSGPGCSRSGR
jgi:hypothetical protein